MQDLAAVAERGDDKQVRGSEPVESPTVAAHDADPNGTAQAPVAVDTLTTRILVVEDDADQRTFLAHLLRSEGYDVLPLNAGEEALLAARGLAPDLVIADMMLSDLDGISLVHSLRADTATRDLPVILIASGAAEDARFEGLDAGADDCLVAPYSARELLARVRGHLKLSRMRREAARVLKELYQTSELARVRAEGASRAKSDFLAVMSHELRTPLNAISGYVQLLDMEAYGPITDAQREVLGRVDRSQRHLLRLINDVLNLARVESGHVDYSLEPVPVAELVSSVMPMIEPQLLRKGLSRSVEIPSSLTVWADREMTQQVLLNLLANAVKFTPPGGRVLVDAVPDAASERVALRVSDTGPGVPEEKQQAIFEPFVQVDTSRTRQASGTGLGLAISRHLARGMGGDLALESRLGRGSTFALLLPEARAD